MRYKILFLIFGYVQFSWTQIHNILDYGAKPESDFINTSAINEAINVCHSKGEARFLFQKENLLQERYILNQILTYT